MDDDKETRGANPNPEARKSRKQVASIVSSSAQPRPQEHGWLSHGLRGMLRALEVQWNSNIVDDQGYLRRRVMFVHRRSSNQQSTRMRKDFRPTDVSELCIDFICFATIAILAKKVHVLKDIDFLFLQIEHHIFVKQCQFNERSMSSYVYCCMVMTNTLEAERTTEEQLDEWRMVLTRTTGSVAKTRSPGSLNAGAQDLET